MSADFPSAALDTYLLRSSDDADPYPEDPETGTCVGCRKERRHLYPTGKHAWPFELCWTCLSGEAP